MNSTNRVSSEQGAIILQYLARALFAVLAVIYFHHTPQFFVTVPESTPWLIAGAYLGLQLLLLISRADYAVILASTLDMVVLGVVMLLDGGEPPPTMALLFLAVLSNGLLYGLKRFLVMLLAAEVVLAIVLPIRMAYLPAGVTQPASASLFLLAALTVCMIYFGLMIWRNQVLGRSALEAAWNDPQTGFISRAALVSTAGWMIPLHDRLSSPLTVVLLQHPDLNGFADAIIQRLRRSDVVARNDDDQLALLLPCTGGAEASQVIEHLRQRMPDLRAAVLTLNSSNLALEQVLHHLQQALPRSRDDDTHWLVYAPPLD
jgi:hypothetical protein